MVTGPRDEVVTVRTSLPSARRVKTLADPVVPSAHRTTQTVPLTVASALGWVMKTLTGLVGGGGGAASTRLPIMTHSDHVVVLWWLPLRQKKA
jgi:hypothetical protein